MKRILALLCAMTALATPAAAELELSFYSGVQEVFDSHVRGDANGRDFDFLADWEGRSFGMPPHWGLRATWWRSENLGFGVEFEHTKAYASDDTLKEFGFEILEFSDGLNSLTANVFYRWPGLWAKGRLTPYAGAGLGLAIPHVEVRRTGSDDETFEYQLAGPSAMLAAGARYALNESWAVFGEYKSTFSMLSTDLEGGGELESNISTWGINFGVSYSF
ncbi:outer membrane protein [Aliiruegeria sabulilitoris]|uniref:outer membrane protein n=1 Tax=Aliiruegeria sabulilitoris TaxID=1510458 RepID=UPI000830C386|nr:outer membrane beta-barrel protein [Aliiruegeria sabulilitoris]NDR57709.1 porin family protein [Pseudoruegeria sp. M32A2M]